MNRQRNRIVLKESLARAGGESLVYLESILSLWCGEVCYPVLSAENPPEVDKRAE